ncbi:MAG TPA: RdgB/HAM1 family non-canonical purine NTP pyrophosphatase [Patescibacteria group bacterium]|nr:RdgB/HAM1 family non-canonical purine NTP pyrophosphatase [Patescibacteria group bacterium]
MNNKGMTILLATGNAYKIREITAVLKTVSPELTVYSFKDLAREIAMPEETGVTLEENAFLKAVGIFETTGVPCIADDTGLEIQALGGAPGVYSARFAGHEANDMDNRSKVLGLLKDKENRTSKFRTVICFHDGIRTIFGEGEISGEILQEERGGNGFGYDSIFQPENSDRTFAEMDPDEKNSQSHRTRALQDFLMRFKKLFEMENAG